MVLLFLAVLGIGFGPGVDTASAAAGASAQALLPGLATVDPPCAGCGTGPVKLHGGPVQHHPRIILDFWGPKWQQDTAVIPAMITLFQSLAGGQYNNILTQYSDDNGPIANDAALDQRLLGTNGNPVVSRMIDPTTPVATIPGRMSMDDIGIEARKFLNDHSWTYTADTQVIVFPQQGTAYDPQDLGDACGRHAFGVDTAQFAYALVKYTSDTDCNFGGTDPQGNMTKVAAHEYAETATDPQYKIFFTHSGWATDGGDEIGDLCNDYGRYYVPPTGTPSIYVQELWSNADNGCVLSRGQEFVSPDKTYPFNGKHTVQGPILTKYLQLGTSLLGEPISEQQPTTGGYVSYFQGTTCGGTTTYGAIYLMSGNSTAYSVHGCIDKEYLSLGGPSTSSLGLPVTDEMGVTGGRVSYFSGHKCSTGGGPSNSGSAIYANGAHTYYVWGCIYGRYQDTCQQVNGPCVNLLGLPVTSEESIAGGKVSYFAGTVCNGGYTVKDEHGVSQLSGSAIYAHGTFETEVHGCIYQKYTHLGGPSSYLGFPITDEMSTPGGRVSYFQGTTCAIDGQTYGAIYSSGAGVYVVYGCIERAYVSLGGSGSYLGMPISDLTSITGGSVAYFQGTTCGGTTTYGAIYSSSSGTYAVHGCLDQKYESLGGPNSNLGFPVSNEYTNSAGHRESDFVGGSIIYMNGAAVVTFNCVGLGTCN
jgi:uncharacterized protein with LGFP repeats